MRVGILKPDHLGDLILAAPAIAALQRRFRDLTLFCHPRNLPLAHHLFPNLRALPIHLPHLDKERTVGRSTAARRETLREHIDLLIGLRWDGQCERLLSIPDIEYHVPGPHESKNHVALDHKELVTPLTGEYKILDSYEHRHCPAPASRPAELRNVGFCIAAGYRLNAWPLNHWLGLAERLRRHGTQVVLIGGPAESDRLRVLGTALHDSLGQEPRSIVGGNDFGATLQRVAEETDLVVATDSGTAHLAALVRPVVSLFGGSPWRRFAPLGRFNMVLSRRVWCSPCIQFSRAVVNLCHTQECLSNLLPEQVYACIMGYVAGIDLSREVQLNNIWMSQAPWSASAA